MQSILNNQLDPTELAGRVDGKLHYLTDDQASWYILAKQWFPCPSDSDFQSQWDLHPEERHLLKIFGKTVAEKRWSTSWGIPYKYSGATNPARPIADNHIVQLLIDKANDLVVQQQPSPFNAMLQNWYEPTDTIGKHADDESANRQGLPIFSLSWGGTRRFLFYAKKDRKSKTELYLEDGDLLIMGGTCQQTHHHEVPKVRKTMDPPTTRRINFTVRAFVVADESDDVDDVDDNS